MPRTINSSLLAHLSEPVVTLATLILITRLDGVQLAFTSWDVPIVYNTVTYIPAISMSPSAVKSNADLTTDQMDIIGAIDSDFIHEADIDAGRYDNATVVVARINPYHTSWGVMIDLTGSLQQVGPYGDGTFQVAISSLGMQLTQQFGDIVTPMCRAILGDSQCKVNMTGFRHAATVASVSVDNRTLTFVDSQITGYYDFGLVKFNSIGGGGGSNYNLNLQIKTSVQLAGTTTIVIQEPAPYLVLVGDAVILEAGCDKRPLTCRAKFNNLVNIHADPYVPGNGYLLTTGRPPS